MLLFFIWPRQCPFLRLVCWVEWQWMLLFPVGQLWGRGQIWVFEPSFLSGMGLLVQAGSQNWSHEGLVNEQSPDPSTHRASLRVRNELFSWWDSVSACSRFLQGNAMPGFPHSMLLSRSTPTYGLFQLCVLPLIPRQRGNVPSVYLTTSFVQRGYNWLPSCVSVCGSLPNSVLCSPGRLADLFGWKRVSYRAVQAGSRGFTSACVWRVPVFLDACSNLSSVLCIALLLVRLQTHKAERDLHRLVAFKGSVSVSIIAGPSIPSCLQFSVLWFSAFYFS
jgi:hypothetical protein